MKKILLLSSLLLPFAVLFGQTFNSPESVEYDAANNRWLVGNNGAGTIVSFYPASATTVPFCSGIPSGPHGLEIMGNTLYVCDGAYIRGYDLATGNSTFTLNTGATFLNGLTTDGSNYLFATDFSAKKIYRINPAGNSFNIMCTTGTQSPNGIYYDGANNRCVFVNWGTNAPIKAMSLADSTVTTVTTTTLSSCDGITRDNAGYWYVTNWGANALARFTPSFTGQTSVMTGLSGPADIDINTAGDSIGIPNSNSTTVVFYTGITTGVKTEISATNVSCFPNPAKDQMNITFAGQSFKGMIEIYSADGKLLETEAMDGFTTTIDLTHYVNGNYIVKFRDENANYIATKEFSVIR